MNVPARYAAVAVAVSAAIFLTVARPHAREVALLRVSVTPKITIAPATVKVIAQIDRNAGNRVLVVEADSGDYYRSSEIQLDGADAAGAYEVWFRSLPPGDYEITAVLENDHGNGTKASTTAKILGAEDK